MEMNARRAIRDAVLLRRTGIVMGCVFALFLLHDMLHLLPATVALGGAAVLLLWTRTEPDKAFKAVEWSTLFFFIGNRSRGKL